MLRILTLIRFIAKCFFGRFIGNKGSIVITTTLMGFNVIFCFILFYFIYFFEKTYLINLIQIISTCIFDDWKSKEYYISIFIMFVIFCTILIFLILFFLINLILNFFFIIILLCLILYIYCLFTGFCDLHQYFVTTDVYSMVILFPLPAKREIFFLRGIFPSTNSNSKFRQIAELSNLVKTDFNRFKNDLILNFKIYLFTRILESDIFLWKHFQLFQETLEKRICGDIYGQHPTEYSMHFTWWDIIRVKFYNNIIFYFANWTEIMLIICGKNYKRQPFTTQTIINVCFKKPYEIFFKNIDWIKHYFITIKEIGIKSTAQWAMADRIPQLNNVIDDVSNTFAKSEQSFSLKEAEKKQILYPMFNHKDKNTLRLCAFIFTFFYFNKIFSFIFRIVFYIILPYFLIFNSRFQTTLPVSDTDVVTFGSITDKIRRLSISGVREMSSGGRVHEPNKYIQPGFCTRKIIPSAHNHPAIFSEAHPLQLQTSGAPTNSLLRQNFTSQPSIFSRITGRWEDTILLDRDKNLLGQTRPQYMLNMAVLVDPSTMKELSADDKNKLNQGVYAKGLEVHRNVKATHYQDKTGTYIKLNNPVGVDPEKINISLIAPQQTTLNSKSSTNEDTIVDTISGSKKGSGDGDPSDFS